jgi:hypothetical protein
MHPEIAMLSSPCGFVGIEACRRSLKTARLKIGGELIARVTMSGVQDQVQSANHHHHELVRLQRRHFDGG